MRHMLTNVRIHTYQSVHSQSKVQSSIAIARATHVLLVSYIRFNGGTPIAVSLTRRVSYKAGPNCKMDLAVT